MYFDIFFPTPHKKTDGDKIFHLFYLNITPLKIFSSSPLDQFFSSLFFFFFYIKLKTLSKLNLLIYSKEIKFCSLIPSQEQKK
jgi:hypothetical protein